jgi:hypothetical protein
MVFHIGSCLYNELVFEIGTTYDSNVLLAREKCEKQRVHISKYMQLLEEHENVLSAKEAKSMSKVVLSLVLHHHICPAVLYPCSTAFVLEKSEIVPFLFH